MDHENRLDRIEAALDRMERHGEEVDHRIDKLSAIGAWIRNANPGLIF